MNKFFTLNALILIAIQCITFYHTTNFVDQLLGDFLTVNHGIKKDTFRYNLNCRGCSLKNAKKTQELYGDAASDFVRQKLEQYLSICIINKEITSKVMSYCLENFGAIFKGGACPSMGPDQLKNEKLFNMELPIYKSQFKIQNYYPEVFFSRHGLRFAHPKILEYIKHRDIIDLGAYIGDSALVLRNYTDKTIYSYEFSPINSMKYLENMKANGVNDRFVLIQKGIGSKIETLHSGLVKTSSANLNSNGSYIANITTIDHEVDERKIIPGFIKADIEGFGYEAFIGGIMATKKYRPVFQLSIYHNLNEFFGLPDGFLALENYVIEYEQGSYGINTYGELTIFAYPAEIIYPPP